MRCGSALNQIRGWPWGMARPSSGPGGLALPPVCPKARELTTAVLWLTVADTALAETGVVVDVVTAPPGAVEPGPPPAEGRLTVPPVAGLLAGPAVGAELPGLPSPGGVGLTLRSVGARVREASAAGVTVWLLVAGKAEAAPPAAAADTTALVVPAPSALPWAGVAGAAVGRGWRKRTASDPAAGTPAGCRSADLTRAACPRRRGIRLRGLLTPPSSVGAPK